MKIAFQGEPASFGELAARQFYGDKKEYIPFPEFQDVYDAVYNRKVHYGIIPLENSLGGSIHQNYDLLLDGKLSIVGEIYLKVSHYLLSNKNVSRQKIKRVFSHQQALTQCKKYLSKFPYITAVPVSNTAAAVQMIKEKKLNDAAAIASMQAAIDFDMRVHAKKIEDVHNNQTRFIMLSKKALTIRTRTRRVKTSIIFATKNIPGALFKAMSVFSLRDIDLLKIESRPFYGRNFEYMFYLDFEGNNYWKRTQNALNNLNEITTYYRNLGSYFVGEIAQPEYKIRK